MYTYPDKSDLLTVSLIQSVSEGDYWSESESRVLTYAFQALKARKNVRLLDVGCGHGRLFPVFAPYVDSIFALEPDSGRFAYAQKSAAQVTQIPVTVVNSDVSALSDGQTFDAALLSHVLQHITCESIDFLLDALARHIAPGGCVMATTTHVQGTEDMLTIEYFEDGRRTCREVDKPRFEQSFSQQGVLPVRLFAQSTVEALFAKHGFTRLTQMQYYHYCRADKAQTAAMDAERNAAGDGAYARDILYIFERG